MEDRNPKEEGLRVQPHWYGWASPVGLSIGFLCTLGGFALLALWLTLLASIS
jgi:hypothetical protein